MQGRKRTIYIADRKMLMDWYEGKPIATQEEQDILDEIIRLLSKKKTIYLVEYGQLRQRLRYYYHKFRERKITQKETEWLKQHKALIWQAKIFKLPGTGPILKMMEEVPPGRSTAEEITCDEHPDETG
jgi:hypothetical protein